VELSAPAIVCLALVYAGVMLVLVYALADRFPRRDVLVRSTQAEEIPFALQAGQTIVGVTETPQAVCFVIGHEVLGSTEEE
jgi:hypothetical protein